MPVPRPMFEFRRNRGTEQDVMTDADAPKNPDRRSIEHELWLAMKAAYNKHRTSSMALDAIISEASGDIPSSIQPDQFVRATTQQRRAFENYIDARIALSQAMAGRSHAEDIRAPLSPLRMSAAAVVLVCATSFTTAFALNYWPGENKRVRDLIASREEMGAKLNQTRDTMQALARKLDALYATRQVAVQADTGTSAAPAAAPEEVRRSKPVQMPPGKPEARSYYKFILAPSTRFKRVGQVSLAVPIVDAKHRTFDVQILVNGYTLKRKHVGLFQPVRVNLHDPQRSIELVMVGIDRARVHGYITEPTYTKSELAASQVRSRFPGHT